MNIVFIPERLETLLESEKYPELSTVQILSPDASRVFTKRVVHKSFPDAPSPAMVVSPLVDRFDVHKLGKNLSISEMHLRQRGYTKTYTDQLMKNQKIKHKIRFVNFPVHEIMPKRMSKGKRGGKDPLAFNHVYQIMRASDHVRSKVPLAESLAMILPAGQKVLEERYFRELSPKGKDIYQQRWALMDERQGYFPGQHKTLTHQDIEEICEFRMKDIRAKRKNHKI